MKISPALSGLLWPFSLIYEGVVRLRAWLYASGVFKQKRLKGIVISVGNITVGGTGKTPMVIWLAEKFLREGKRVAILSRGYRGTGGTSDEIELMKNRLQGGVLFGVGKDRCTEGRRLEAEGANVFLLDDGFQHLQLARDVDLVLIDRSRPLTAEKLLPAGRLREPASALNRADIVIYTRTDGAGNTVQTSQQLKKLPSFPCTTRLLGFRRFGADQTLRSLAEIANGTYFAFCGIGNPDAFFLDLKRWGVRLAGQRAFRDHRRYTSTDVAKLEAEAARLGASGLVTTEKDFYNLGGANCGSIPVYACVIEIEILNQKEFFQLIGSRIAQRQAAVA